RGAAARRGRADRGARAREARRRCARGAARRRSARGVGVAAPRVARADLPERRRGEPQMSQPHGLRSARARGAQLARGLACIWAIAVNTVRESVRSKLLYGLLFFAVLMIGSGAVVASLSYVEGDRILQDVGMGSVRLFGVAIAILVGINLIHREVDRRTVYTILSKPLSRGEFLVGKFLGLTLTIWLQMAIMGVAFVGVSL